MWYGERVYYWINTGYAYVVSTIIFGWSSCDLIKPPQLVEGSMVLGTIHRIRESVESNHESVEPNHESVEPNHESVELNRESVELNIAIEDEDFRLAFFVSACFLLSGCLDGPTLALWDE